MNESKRRSILKAVSWRIFASIDTFLIAWLISGSVSISSWIAGIEAFTKVFLYYFHERLWNKVSWAKKN
ncbi:MAG: DUF2061 domain-containing protein [Proteobacteria bacterium]|nr:DUF2061 domain-containing protein [Pseudomonadota bacterium]MDA0971677.1 DUF2061 domain-containing protein [Pseudomonadota bacterium]MDA0996184.1 DUF2061 domain-containing protein [Pseudomonadota bacterium]